ncbi:YopX family protein [Leuconostoc gasicomitatum]|uniref:YopX family protein n=1 Tax=Leuconostoc gasicomitatum TaxID=115778 RepID=UPI001CC4EF8B|nr:YopX family protein [Leuconostoc gasicomitatum]MBZ5971611.1 hypothetical protein [Leuconostoc gasicomitatum]
MSREIKFRVWDNEGQKYIKIENFYISPEDGAAIDIGGYEYRGAVIEQFTGLKDANGVDIYDGDLVREVPEYDDDYMVIYEIVHNETSNYPAFDLKGWRGEMNGISELSLTSGIEVVGNINQNKDLLEEK